MKITVFVLLLGLCLAQAVDLEDKRKEDLEIKTKVDVSTMEAFTDKLRSLINNDIFNPFWIPYLPLISFSTASLALTEVNIVGLTDVEIDNGLNRLQEYDVKLHFPVLSFLSAHYIAGGKLLDLNFVGESKANATLASFDITFSVGLQSGCVKENSTAFVFTAGDIFVNIADLNPDHSEQGVLINSMLESFGDDLLKWLSLGLSPGGSLHAKIDPVLVNAINSRNPLCRSEVQQIESEKEVPELNLYDKNLFTAMQELGDYLASIVGYDFLERFFVEHFQEWMMNLEMSNDVKPRY